jgi:ATP phosphoribosyltransferase regulatory subunit HisZ
MAPECQQKNAKGLTMVAIGMNKAADEFLILDDRTREELASGKYRDQRRGTFGPPAPAAGPRAPAEKLPSAHSERAAPAPARPARPQATAGPKPTAQQRARQPWTRSQERLALLYNEQGLRPSDIAAKLGISSHLATQIILAARNRGKS